MNRDLHEKIGEVSYENLFAGLEPKIGHFRDHCGHQRNPDR